MNSRIEVIKKKPLYDVMGELTYFKCFERKKNISTLIEFLHFRPQYIYKNIKQTYLKLNYTHTHTHS